MKVGLLCEVLYPPLDEGVRLFAAGLARALASHHEVLLMSERGCEISGMPVHGALTNRWFLSGGLKKLLRTFEPDVLIYIPWTSLTSRTFARVHTLRRYARGARLGLIALQPRRIDLLMRAATGLGCPDSVLAVGPGAERQARTLGIRAARIPAGVDTDRFRPASATERSDLRARVHVEEGAFVVLHVGHIKDSRNIGILEQIARIEDVACVMVASTSTRTQGDLCARLEGAGVRVVSGHQRRIEDLYRMADAYLFPVESVLDAIEAPLSVLEAAACDLRVLSTPYGGLPDLLSSTGSDGGVTWIHSGDEMIAEVRRLSASSHDGPPASGARKLVERLSWAHVAGEILDNLRSGDTA